MAAKIKILIPTDFSIASNKAVDFCLEFSRKFETELIVLHVNEHFIPATDVPFEIYENEIKINTARSKEGVKLIIKDIKSRRPDVKVIELVEEGSPAEVIRSVSRTQKVDLVVMGTHGKSRLQKMLFGSVSSGLIEESAAPLILIPENYSYQPIKHIVYASNFLDQDVEAIKDLGIIARAFGSSIHVLHIEQQVELQAAPWKEKFEMQVRDAAGIDSLYFDYVYDKNIRHGMQNYVEKMKPNLIVMLTRTRGLFEKVYDPSLTDRFSFHHTIPLMVFHKDSQGNPLNF